MKVEICPRCSGIGETREDIGTHQSEYIYHKCTYCNGTGRVYTNIYSYMVSFDIDKERLYEIDAEIIKLIRSMK